MCVRSARRKATGGVIQEVTIDPRRIGRPYRFIYGLCIRDPRPCNVLNTCCRVDILSGSVAMWSEPGVLPAGGLVRPCPFLLFSTWLHTFVPNRSSEPPPPKPDVSAAAGCSRGRRD